MQIKEIIDERREYVKILLDMLPFIVDIEKDFLKELRLMQHVVDQNKIYLLDYHEAKNKFKKIKDQMNEVTFHLEKNPSNELYINFEHELQALLVQHKIIFKKNKMKLREHYDGMEMEILRHLSMCIKKIKSTLEKSPSFLLKRQKVKYHDRFLLSYCENWQKKEISQLDEMIDSLQLIIGRAHEAISGLNTSISLETVDLLNQGGATNHISMLKNAKVFSDYKNIEKYLRNFNKIFPEIISLEMIEQIYKSNMLNYYSLDEKSIPIEQKNQVLIVSDDMLKESFYDVFELDFNSNFFGSVKTKEKLIYLRENIKSLIQYLGEVYQERFLILEELKQKKKKLQNIAKTEDELTYETIRKWLEKDKSLFFKEIFQYLKEHPFFYDDESLSKNYVKEFLQNEH